ncbi:signal-induced proliferation-associated 1-like protein 2 [Bacillus rossius redtenbacheri]|uniref:signal-induced proliferation-associated 1-like protein 2 n=1 Tax=Bacillus rossius redtenbacheri TaxID=93214 RepID=UPI002FDDC65E
MIGAAMPAATEAPYRGSRLRPQEEALYRSNSSLELLAGQHHHQQQQLQQQQQQQEPRREYGSHGSLDVLSSSSDSFFAMLQDYRPAVLGALCSDQRSPGPAEFLKGKVEPPPASENASNALAEEGMAASTSPKLRLKLQRLWAGARPPRPAADDTLDSGEERLRRRCLAHHDCQSMAASLGCAARLRGLLLGRRRNTATGASAASMVGARAATPEGAPEPDEDPGDGRGNHLLESCPFFRNEVGGEGERVVSLTRQAAGPRRRPLHRPHMAAGVSVLEFPPGDTHWRHGTCPFERQPRSIESVDQGALYYRNYFHGHEHQNWFGMDENLGPLAISIRRERLEGCESPGQQQYHYRLLIRTSELMTLRGSVLEEAIPNLKPPSNSKTLNTKEVLEYVAPEIQLSCLRLAVPSQQTEDQLLKLDEQGLTTHYKVGVMYCSAGQSTEEEMYNNEDAGPAFHEFLEMLGQRVRLKGFHSYKAGLDNKTDSTGLYSVYAQYHHCEVMFHVSTLLPFTPNNRQQLLRKRHIGNDIVTIVFQEPGALPFTPKNIRSQFQHVFIVVRVINPCTDNTQYSVAVSRSKEVPVFGPPIHESATFSKSKAFAEFLLAKIINAENAAHRSEKFATMATRTRQEYLKDLAANYTTSIVLETGQKFSIMSFSSSKKKERAGRPRFVPGPLQRGAICWQVVLDDGGQSMLVDCFLGISTDTFVLVEESSREMVFVAPCQSVLGWHTQASSVRVYHHQGECTTIHTRDGADHDELLEIVARLQAVTGGCEARELTLRRNQRGQLGFNVQPDGVVTQVEGLGPAWQAGLRQGSRLVEICKVAVSTLSHDQMVDLLKTAVVVTVTLIPPLPDGSLRRGCSAQSCRLTWGSFEGDYENVSSPSPEEGISPSRKPQEPQSVVPGNYRRWYERNVSPPRSSNSSGYGTASSNKSFTDSRFPANPEGTLTSSSSGHSSDDRWYELLDTVGCEGTATAKVVVDTPPPLPARLGSSGGSAFQHVPPAHKAKVQVSHSLPLPHASFSLPLTQPDLRPAKVSEATVKPHQNDSSSTPSDCSNSRVVNDGHSTDTSSTSDRLCGARSEDELSTGSGNVSPRLRRASKQQGGTLTPSSGSSRNQSPRPKDTGEARLRPGVTPKSNRNSANLASSTLQEDLMRLINPDYLGDAPPESGGKKEETVVVVPSAAGKVHSSSRSRENLCGPSSQDTSAVEVILTMARPATVISNASTASSPAPSENKLLSKEERLSPRATKADGGPKLPLPQEMDWPSLVDTATRAMLQVRDEVPEAARNGESLGHWVDDMRLGLTSAPSTGRRVTELHTHLASLECRVAQETRLRQSLEDEVRRLRDENRRLQEESHTAAQQLRRFTEWFFQTIDKQ